VLMLEIHCRSVADHRKAVSGVVEITASSGASLNVPVQAPINSNDETTPGCLTRQRRPLADLMARVPADSVELISDGSSDPRRGLDRPEGYSAMGRKMRAGRRLASRRSFSRDAETRERKS